MNRSGDWCEKSRGVVKRQYEQYQAFEFEMPVGHLGDSVETDEGGGEDL